MEKILVNKKVSLKEINKEGNLRIYPEAQLAIEKGWESLYFADNCTDFADIIVGEYIMTLGTYGEVRVTSNNGEIELQNIDVEEEKQEILRKIIDEGKLDDYDIHNNNWFAVVIGKISKIEEDTIEYETIDDMVFEACPTSIEDLETEFIEYAISLMQHYATEMI